MKCKGDTRTRAGWPRKTTVVAKRGRTTAKLLCETRKLLSRRKCGIKLWSPSSLPYFMILSVRDPPVDLSSYSSLESRRMDTRDGMTSPSPPLTYSSALAHFHLPSAFTPLRSGRCPRSHPCSHSFLMSVLSSPYLCMF